MSWLLLATAIVVVIAHVFFHVEARTVLTGSMQPRYTPGDIMVTVPRSVDALRVGQIAVLVPPGQTAPVAHRITEMHRDRQGQRVIQTKGDANPTKDDWKAIPTTTQVPVTIARVPMLGRVAMAIHQLWLRLLAIGLIGLALTVVCARRIAITRHCDNCCPASTAG